jgi:hypothetical protein
LNSKSNLFPNGLANSSGVVGRFLMDTPSTGVIGYFPQLAQLPPHNHDGTGLKKKWRETYGTFVSIEGRGEMIPTEKSHCEIDPDVVDQWGIPVLRFHFTWTENDLKMAKDMRDTFSGIIDAAGGTLWVDKIPSA